MTTLDLQVAASADDAQETQADTGFTSTGGNLNLQASTVAPASRTDIGLRFQNVTVAQGATITAATLEVFIATSKSDDPNCNILGENVDNSVSFVTNADLINRARTSASVQWTASNLGTNAFKTSPDIKTVIQEIVNRGSWASGNAMTIIMSGRSDATQTIGIQPFDTAPTSNAVKLHITYSTGTTAVDREHPRGVMRGVTRGVA
jgi:hypothetical protein